MLLRLVWKRLIFVCLYIMFSSYHSLNLLICFLKEVSLYFILFILTQLLDFIAILICLVKNKDNEYLFSTHRRMTKLANVSLQRAHNVNVSLQMITLFNTLFHYNETFLSQRLNASFDSKQKRQRNRSNQKYEV